VYGHPKPSPLGCSSAWCPIGPSAPHGSRWALRRRLVRTQHASWIFSLHHGASLEEAQDLGEVRAHDVDERIHPGAPRIENRLDVLVRGDYCVGVGDEIDAGAQPGPQVRAIRELRLNNGDVIGVVGNRFL
jgi:hypothetical protein